MELSGLGKISYAKQKQCKLPALVLCFRHSFAMNTVKASEYIYLNFCMLYVIHTKYMQCLNKLWGIIIKWTLVNTVPVLWGHSLHIFLQPSSPLTSEVASNFMHACFLIRGYSFTQHLTWELPPNYSGWFFVCLFLFFGVVMVKCLLSWNVFRPEISVFKMLRPTVSLGEGLPHVNEEQIFN